jgi:hypothetical protein
VAWRAVWFQVDEPASKFGRSDNYWITNGEVRDRKLLTLPEVLVGLLSVRTEENRDKNKSETCFRIEMPLYDA